MHLVSANSAFDLPLPGRRVPVSRSVRRSLQRQVGLLGVVAQAVFFFAVLWLLAAAPGFLSAQDSLVPVGADRAAAQASR